MSAALDEAVRRLRRGIAEMEERHRAEMMPYYRELARLEALKLPAMQVYREHLGALAQLEATRKEGS